MSGDDGEVRSELARESHDPFGGTPLRELRRGLLTNEAACDE
jgi:hypothetical protein